jgi:hypothetical protein
VEGGSGDEQMLSFPHSDFLKLFKKIIVLSTRETTDETETKRNDTEEVRRRGIEK